MIYVAFALLLIIVVGSTVGVIDLYAVLKYLIRRKESR